MFGPLLKKKKNTLWKGFLKCRKEPLAFFRIRKYFFFDNSSAHFRFVFVTMLYFFILRYLVTKTIFVTTFKKWRYRALLLYMQMETTYKHIPKTISHFATSWSIIPGQSRALRPHDGQLQLLAWSDFKSAIAVCGLTSTWPLSWSWNAAQPS